MDGGLAAQFKSLKISKVAIQGGGGKVAGGQGRSDAGVKAERGSSPGKAKGNENVSSTSSGGAMRMGIGGTMFAFNFMGDTDTGDAWLDEVEAREGDMDITGCEGNKTKKKKKKKKKKKAPAAGASGEIETAVADSDSGNNNDDNDDDDDEKEKEKGNQVAEDIPIAVSANTAAPAPASVPFTKPTYGAAVSASATSSEKGQGKKQVQGQGKEGAGSKPTVKPTSAPVVRTSGNEKDNNSGKGKGKNNNNNNNKGKNKGKSASEDDDESWYCPQPQQQPQISQVSTSSSVRNSPSSANIIEARARGGDGPRVVSRKDPYLDSVTKNKLRYGDGKNLVLHGARKVRDPHWLECPPGLGLSAPFSRTCTGKGAVKGGRPARPPKLRKGTSTDHHLNFYTSGLSVSAGGVAVEEGLSPAPAMLHSSPFTFGFL